ncbi:hypothetical protein AAZX31_15G226800 [Glycine max]
MNNGFIVVNRNRLNGFSSGVISLKFQGAKQVLVKLGHKGSAQKPIQQPAILSKTVVDTTDAGDTFTAAFTVALVEGKSKKECLGFVIVECNSFFLFGKTCLTIMFCNSCCSLSLCSSEGSLSLHA